jgi:hypothetical protein
VTSSLQRPLLVCFDFETDRDERDLFDGRESKLEEESESESEDTEELLVDWWEAGVVWVVGFDWLTGRLGWIFWRRSMG